MSEKCLGMIMNGEKYFGDSSYATLVVTILKFFLNDKGKPHRTTARNVNH
jgi:hypothetical protein